MGQEQSGLNNASKKQPSSVQSELSNKNTPTQTEEDSEPVIPQQGIIQVVTSSNQETIDDELKQLKQIPKFEPFIKDYDKGFSIENLLGITGVLKNSSKESSHDSEELDPLAAILFELQEHIKENVSSIGAEQRILLQRIKYVDELSQNTAQALTTAFNQAKYASEKLSEVNTIREQAKQAQKQASEIFKALSSLEQFLDPDDIADNNDRWLYLKALSEKASKASPSFERMIRSTDFATGSSTSPLLERVVVTGSTNDLTEYSDETPSKALNHLRGLSSKSIPRMTRTDHDVVPPKSYSEQVVPKK